MTPKSILAKLDAMPGPARHGCGGTLASECLRAALWCVANAPNHETATLGAAHVAHYRERLRIHNAQTPPPFFQYDLETGEPIDADGAE